MFGRSLNTKLQGDNPKYVFCYIFLAFFGFERNNNPSRNFLFLPSCLLWKQNLFKKYLKWLILKISPIFKP